MITFNTLSRPHTVIESNEFFRQYHCSEAPFMPDWNYCQLLFQPYLQEFKLIEEMHSYFSRQHHLSYVKFYWPDNTPLTPEITRYLDNHHYALEMLALYTLTPDSKPPALRSDIRITPVDAHTLDTFKSINIEEDRLTSQRLAEDKPKAYDLLYNLPQTTLYLAYIEQHPVGSFILHSKQDTLEIDHLLTVPDYRLTGVARHIIHHVAQLARQSNRTVILLSDAESSVSCMYQQLGFTQQSYIIGAIDEH